MSKMKKLASVLLALVMALAMTCTAFADTTYTITISNSTEGYTYVAYQIFTGTLDSTGTVLSDIDWGTGVNGSALLAALQADTTEVGTDAEGNEITVASLFASCTSAADVAQVLSDNSTNEALAERFAELAAANKSTTVAGTSVYSEDNKNYTISGLSAGYYLVINTEVPDDDDDTNAAYSNYILKVVTNVTVSPKSDYPSFDKSVGTTVDGDMADSDDATEDYAVGDSVLFTLTATLPSNYGDYTTYTLVFTDTLSEGLDVDTSSVVVTIDGVTIPSTYYTVSEVTTNSDGTTTFTVTLSDLKSIEVTDLTISAGSKVVVTYSATLNEDAGSIEYNDASLTYSNNPNDSSNTGTTPDDKTYVVTFTVVVNKTKSDGTTALEGAAFTLYKEVSVDKESFEDGTYYTITDGVVTEATEYDGDATYYVALETISSGTTFTFDGLDIGNYVLVETTTPDGYNTADPITFTISASAVENATEEDGVEVTITSPTEDDGFTISGETTLTTTVKNYAGSELPSTGGIGTTIFYIVGGVMVLGAAVLLITRRRMSTR
ncbi:MAG: SpaH/EbpB family LPXTG-anchored major pilin [Lachnospiraceae bacterium]|nr:SpaH/EbpB family LPXTG-anchored major pilin [Lachnospiraceae bacterium]